MSTKHVIFTEHTISLQFEGALYKRRNFRSAQIKKLGTFIKSQTVDQRINQSAIVIIRKRKLNRSSIWIVFFQIRIYQ